jgi:hypothetical protein
MRLLVAAVVVWGGVLAAPHVGVARALPAFQQGTGGGTGTSPSGRSAPSRPMSDRTDPAPPDSPLTAEMEARRVRALKNDRQRRIVDDTAKLVSLANELKADVDKTSKDEMSLDVIRKAEEIEKLARDVKQRMKG